jgi:hypothetical protein
MTTIAIDSMGFVAADGLRTWGGDIVARDEQKVRVRYGRIYALTGIAGGFEPLIKWHGEHKADPERLPKIGGDDDSWTLIVIERPGEVMKFTKTCPYPECFRPPVAFGAGLDLAKGAMLWGATAPEAVKLVSEHTNHTGGEIQVVNISEALGLQPIREAAE